MPSTCTPIYEIEETPVIVALTKPGIKLHLFPSMLDLYMRGFYAIIIGIKACLSVQQGRLDIKFSLDTASQNWYKKFPLCSKIKISILCHCLHDLAGMITA